MDGDGTWDGCGIDKCIGAFGGLHVDRPVTGDWTANGRTKIGIYRNGAWYLDRDGDGIWDGCGMDTCVDSFGGFAEDIPVVPH